MYIVYLKKIEENGSLLSQHAMGRHSQHSWIRVHEVLHGAWWCDSPSGLQGQNSKSSNHLKIFKNS